MPFVQDDVSKKIKQMRESDPEFDKAFDLAQKERQIVSAIIKERKKLGISQQEFASMVGLKQQSVSTFERLEESPSLKKLVQYVSALGMELRVVKKRRISAKKLKLHQNSEKKPVLQS